ncbi:hypothetical protein [Mahella australiensis]|uniref:Uncharacterized protein n=1 Tax=Mahella australiensis (strain DSM 15567 / CIP 107919 / 50-1 BON) TaxID=697281 RepID=F3ZZY8_MAHA5|nr:hypothetical protein [Mahella australiensis]AEE95806.1 hypothetical protein Mahau_0603 [Mahella australiensis 50-1 BON]
MKQIKISADTKKTWTRMPWLEEVHEETVIPAGTELFHVSTYDQIDAFAPIETCFTYDRPFLQGEIYMLKVSRPVKAVVVDDYEVRIDLGRVTDCVDIEIYYVGHTEFDSRYTLVNQAGNIVDRCIHYVVEPEFAELGQRWNEHEIRAIETRAKIYPLMYHIENR